MFFQSLFKDLINPFIIFDSSAQKLRDRCLNFSSINFCLKEISVIETHSLIDLLAILRNRLNSVLLPPLPSAMFKQIDIEARLN